MERGRPWARWPRLETLPLQILKRDLCRTYLDYPQANEDPFSEGWFRTSNQGFRDETGYFTITGGLKEPINRGG